MALLLADLVVAAVLCGLIWTIQIVHYPLFAAVPAAGWVAYEREHQRRIARLVAPLMHANVSLAVAVGVAGDGDALLRWVGAVLAVAVFAATGGVFSALHSRLAAGRDPAVIARLVALNWWRTAAWTLQTSTAVVLVAQAA